MTEITAEKIGIGFLIGCGIWLVLAFFINGVVYASDEANFNFDKWQWYTWFLFYAGCATIITTGIVLTPTLQLRVFNRIKRGKSGKGHRQLTKDNNEMLKLLVKKEN